jgi:hypothetical protein
VPNGVIANRACNSGHIVDLSCYAGFRLLPEIVRAVTERLYVGPQTKRFTRRSDSEAKIVVERFSSDAKIVNSITTFDPVSQSAAT